MLPKPCTLLALVFVFLVPFSANAMDLREECTSFYHKKPSFEVFENLVTSTLPSDNRLIFEAKDYTLWKPALEEHYSQYNPRDIFCLFGEHVVAPKSDEILDTDGGSLFIWSSTNFTTPENLVPPLVIDDQPILLELARSVMVEVNLHLSHSCHRQFPFQRNARIDCLLEGKHTFNRLKQRLNRDLTHSSPPPAGSVVPFPYSLNATQSDLIFSVQSFVDFAISSQTHELAFSMLYNQTTERTISTGMISTPRQAEGDSGITITGVTHWLSIIVEDIASQALYKTAIGILERTEQPNQPESLLAQEAGPISLYNHFAREQDRSILDEIVSQFVCFQNYQNILSIYQEKEFWLKLPDYQTILCGHKMTLDNKDEDFVVFDASVSAQEDDPDHLRSLLVLAQNEQIGARAEKALGGLETAVIEQTDLINSIKAILTRGEYREEEGILMSELRQMEEQIAQASNLAGPFIAALELGASFTDFGSAAWKVFDILSNVPSEKEEEDVPPRSRITAPEGPSEVKETVGAYFWRNGKDLGAASQALGGSLSDIFSKFSRARVGMSLFELQGKREVILNEIRELERQFSKRLSEIRIAHDAYRADLNNVAAKLGRIELRRREVDITVASNLRSIISMNLLGNLWADNASYALDRCKRAVDRISTDRFGAKELEIASGCLGLGERFVKRRECLRGENSDAESDIFVITGRVAVRVLKGKELRCVMSVVGAAVK